MTLNVETAIALSIQYLWFGRGRKGMKGRGRVLPIDNGLTFNKTIFQIVAAIHQYFIAQQISLNWLTKYVLWLLTRIKKNLGNKKTWPRLWSDKKQSKGSKVQHHNGKYMVKTKKKEWTIFKQTFRNFSYEKKFLFLPQLLAIFFFIWLSKRK